MSFAQTIVLGAIAGFTIFIGLPFGRLQRGGRGLRIFLGGLSGGILVFLLFDILSHATEPLEAALTNSARSAWRTSSASGSACSASSTPPAGGVGQRASVPGQWPWPRPTRPSFARTRCRSE